MASDAIANEFREGSYRCVGCSSVLYSSTDKFKTKLKWASFRKAATAEAVRVESEDFTEETYCAKCGKHVGSLFHDGKKVGDEHPDAKDRHLVNAEAVVFEPVDPNEPAPQLPSDAQNSHTMRVNETQERPSTPPMGVTSAAQNAKATNMKSSRGVLKSSQSVKKPASNEPASPRLNSSNGASSSTKQSQGLSTTTKAVVGVLAVAAVGLVGWLGYRSMASSDKKRRN